MSNRLTSAIMVLEARFFLSKYYNKGGLRVLLVIDINKSSGIILGGNKVLREVTGETTAAEVHLSAIAEYLVNIGKRRTFWSLNGDILKITILKTNTPYPSRKIRRIRAYTHQRPQRKRVQYVVSSEDQYAILEI
ncbi:hypothetical protein Tco_0432502 [Tanacetum coccineum]